MKYKLQVDMILYEAIMVLTDLFNPRYLSKGQRKKRESLFSDLNEDISPLRNLNNVDKQNGSTQNQQNKRAAPILLGPFSYCSQSGILKISGTALEIVSKLLKNFDNMNCPIFMKNELKCGIFIKKYANCLKDFTFSLPNKLKNFLSKIKILEIIRIHHKCLQQIKKIDKEMNAIEKAIDKLHNQKLIMMKERRKFLKKLNSLRSKLY